MKKIGFIDYYLDQYHAVKYPAWLKEYSNGEMEVAYAWAKTDKPDGKTNKEFCEENGIKLLDTMEEVIELSDYLVVMSPDNPEQHEELCRLVFASGKPVYVDKTFTATKDSAVRMVDLAKENGTPFFSASAMRFTEGIKKADREGLDAINSVGSGTFENYFIHQLEPIVTLMGSDISKIIYFGTESTLMFALKFKDGRTATISQMGWECGFNMTLNYIDEHSVILEVDEDVYFNLINAIIKFFKDGILPVPPEETLQMMNIIECGEKAMNVPGVWVDIY